MVVDERSRHALYRRLEEVLGSDAATTLIEHLPSVGWADVATKRDLAALEERVDLRFARLDERFNRMEDRLEERFKGMDERTKAMASDLRAAFEHELRSQSNAFGHDLRGQATTTMFSVVSVVLTMAALAFALAKFT